VAIKSRHNGCLEAFEKTGPSADIRNEDSESRELFTDCRKNNWLLFLKLKAFLRSPSPAMPELFPDTSLHLIDVQNVVLSIPVITIVLTKSDRK